MWDVGQKVRIEEEYTRSLKLLGIPYFLVLEISVYHIHFIIVLYNMHYMYSFTFIK